MDFRLWDKAAELQARRYPVRKQRVNHVEWVKALIARCSVDTAYRICRRNSVPRFIYKKSSTENPTAGFYQGALGYLRKHYPYQGKRGVA